MLRCSLFRNAPACLFLALLCVCTTISLADSIKPEELVAKHLDSIGTPEARAKVSSRAVNGQLQFRILSGGHGGVLDGSSVLLTEGHKLVLFMKLPNVEYQGERFIYDGSKIEIRAATAQNRRSAFGEFVRTQDAIIKDGLLGGVLSTGWPLLDVQEHRAKLSSEGVKTIDGEKLLDVRYQPKANTDLDIHLYFDPETFHHVRTVYSLTVHPSFVGGSRGATESGNANQSDSHYRLDERFSDFKTVDGLTLPSHYVIQYSEDRQLGSRGQGELSQWDATEKAIEHNVSPDARNFQVR